jgi:alpha-tubulin suppressor-like RCC1 family protein
MIATSPVTNGTIVAGGVFTCGIANTGQAFCWGDNQFGQLGDGTTTTRLTPTLVATSQVFVSIATGRDFACAMTANREVFCWGNNGSGELGSGATGGPSLTPVRVPSPF